MLVVFGAPLVDSIVPVLPGEVVVAAAATSLGGGSLPVPVVVAVAAAGSLIGECVVFTLARRLARTRRGERIAGGDQGRVRYEGSSDGGASVVSCWRGSCPVAAPPRRPRSPCERARPPVRSCRRCRFTDLGRLPRWYRQRSRRHLLIAGPTLTGDRSDTSRLACPPFVQIGSTARSMATASRRDAVGQSDGKRLDLAEAEGAVQGDARQGGTRSSR